MADELSQAMWESTDAPLFAPEMQALGVTTLDVTTLRFALKTYESALQKGLWKEYKLETTLVLVSVRSLLGRLAKLQGAEGEK